jgi:stage II sporulation protein AB (anti-sigma F factor)
MENNNLIKVEFSSISENESFARNLVSCYALKLNPSISELTDIKTAVSEAVTNVIVHAYKDKIGKVYLELYILQNTIHIKVIDKGVGIDDLSKALEPFFTTGPEDERSGMGFTIIKSFMDSLEVESKIGEGTTVIMSKVIKNK